MVFVILSMFSWILHTFCNKCGLPVVLEKEPSFSQNSPCPSAAVSRSQGAQDGLSPCRP